MQLEEAALADDYFVSRKLYPNVDFYTGVIYKALGFPTPMFTVLFALGRLPGWIAQWREMIEDPATKIGRPRQVYTGPDAAPPGALGLALSYLAQRPAGPAAARARRRGRRASAAVHRSGAARRCCAAPSASGTADPARSSPAGPSPSQVRCSAAAASRTPSTSTSRVQRPQPRRRRRARRRRGSRAPGSRARRRC